MKYTYSSLFQLPALSHQQDEDIVIFKDSHEGIEVYFTKNVDEYCHAIDTGLACGNLMLNGVFGGNRIDSFPRELKEEINRIRESRASRLSSGALLAVSITGDEDLTFNERLHRELENIRICWDAVDIDEIKERHQSFIDTIVASVSAASKPEYGAKRISSGVYFRDENGKPLYSFTAKVGSVTIIASTPITSEIVKLSHRHSQMAQNPGELKRVFQLYVQSLDLSHDKFRSYLFSWAALEIFINKIFNKYYEDEILSGISNGSSARGINSFVSRIRTVMKGKFNLQDKFILISSFLGKNQEEEIALFKRCKDLRDDISHGTEIEDTSLPVEKLRILLAGYVFSHLQREQNPQ